MTGHPDGVSIFLLHGTPGSRNGPKPRSMTLRMQGIKLISYDRAGYGDSDRDPGRKVVDAAADIEAIADQLGIDRFSVVGRSGGGPHALACAARLSHRVDRVAALVSVAPFDANDLDWYGGMTDSNVEEYSRADIDEDAVYRELSRLAERIQEDPEELVRKLRPELSRYDGRIIDDVAMRRMLVATYSEALKAGPWGWIDDVLAFRKHWGFELSEIQVPTLLWHGLDDRFSPPPHTRWLAERIPTSQLELEPAGGHFSAMEVLPEVLSWLSAPADQHVDFYAGDRLARAGV
ncbi:alpha/beta hydrolase [Actinomadura barringtoniae]|uniref:Alpha/beta hydrolase n=1 Tax=Actinomadura barringtoniae TaxID=1427535 RepID=A0A939PDR8_9ACTN|nr:alpha/beta hydrolase [Actinomadura barringtoniae]